MSVSVTDPIGQAINRAKFITFQPFNVGKWFVLGFVAWLATLADGGGANFGGGGGGRNSSRGGSWPGGGSDAPDEVGHWFATHIPEVLGMVVAFTVIGLVIWLLVLWISSRGRFMFLEAIANNTCEVVAPWKRYQYLGNSYAAFRMCLSVIGFGIFLVSLLAGFVIARPDIRDWQLGHAAINGILLGLALLLPSAIVLALIGWCTSNFVTTIMYARNLRVLDAWGEFRSVVMPGNVGTLVLFLIMRIILAIAIGILSVIAGCLTCCIGLLPYLSTVVTLPLHVFDACYAVYFLQQFDPAYVIIKEPPPPAFPVIDVPRPTT